MFPKRLELHVEGSVILLWFKTIYLHSGHRSSGICTASRL